MSTWWVLAAVLISVVVTFLSAPRIAAKLHQSSGHPGFTYDQIHQIYVRKDLQHSGQALLLLGDSHVHALCEGCLDRRALNFGIGGDTIVGLRRRLVDYPSVRDASNIAVVEVGANDLLWEHTTDLPHHFAQLLQDLDSVGYTLVYAVFPMAKSSGKAADIGRINEFNTAIEEICATHKNCAFIRLQALYASDGHLKEEFHIGDGIHLNELGYQAWTADLHAQLAKCQFDAAGASCRR